MINEKPALFPRYRSGLSTVSQSREGLALLVLRGRLCSVELIRLGQLENDMHLPVSALADRRGILFALAFESLRLALLATLAQAKASLRARLYRMCR